MPQSILQWFSLLFVLALYLIPVAKLLQRAVTAGGTTQHECSYGACQKHAQSHAVSVARPAAPNVTLLDSQKVQTASLAS